MAREVVNRDLSVRYVHVVVSTLHCREIYSAVQCSAVQYSTVQCIEVK